MREWHKGVEYNVKLYGSINIITQLAIWLELFLCNIKGQVQSPVKVCEESEVATNVKLYEIEQSPSHLNCI